MTPLEVAQQGLTRALDAFMARPSDATSATVMAAQADYVRAIGQDDVSSVKGGDDVRGRVVRAPRDRTLHTS